MARVRTVELPWTRQPQEAVDPSPEAVAAGLVHLWSAPQGARDLVLGRPQPYIGDPPAVVTRAGLGVALNGSSRAIDTGYKITSPQGSILLLTDVAETGTNLFSQSNNDAGSNYGISLRYGIFSINAVPLVTLSETTGLHAYILTWGLSGVPRAYLDGVEQFEHGSAGGAPDAPSGAYNLHIGAFHYSGGRVFWGNHSPLLFAVWDRALSRERALSINANPWQLFNRTARRIWVPGAGGSTVPNITFVGAENILATSSDYRVTLDFA